MSALARMKLLVNLARVDGSVVESEKKYIINIALANGVSRDEILSLFDRQVEATIPDNLTARDKFQYIFSLVQLMKIDERMYREEIVFCSKIATKLGYDQQVMFDLMLLVKSSEMPETEMEELEKLVEKYLKR